MLLLFAIRKVSLKIPASCVVGLHEGMPDIAMYLSDVDVVEEQPGKASRECYLPVAFAEVKDGNVTPAVCSPQLGWAQASACLALLTAGFDESEIVVPGFSFCGPIYNLEIMMV